MNSAVMQRCDLLAENVEVLNKKFWLENHLMRIVSAGYLAAYGRKADVEHIKECRKLLSSKTGVFSEFRSYSEFVTSTKMSVQPSAEQYIDNAIAIYNKMQKGKIFGSSHRVLASVTICDMGKMNEADRINERTGELMKAMVKKHPFLTSEEDTCFATLLAMTEKSNEQIMEELETTYQILKEKFPFHSNAVFSLAQVLTIYDGAPEAKCERVMSVFTAMKEIGVKYDKEMALAALGLMVNVEGEASALALEIKETEEYLRKKKYFGFLDISKANRLMIALTTIASVYSENDTDVAATAIESTIATVIAQELVMMVAVVSASAAAHSSSSSN